MSELHPRELYKMLRGLVQLDEGKNELPLESLSFRGFAHWRLRADLPEVERDIIGALGPLWRATRMPRWLDRSFKREWDVFLVPEVGLFYPHRHGLSPPANLAQICMLLSDREYLAAVIADGDPDTAATYLRPRFNSFWLSIVPQTEALPYSTVWDRMVRAMMLLATLINQASSVNSDLVGHGFSATHTIRPNVPAPDHLRTAKT
ncbi:MAG: hypothetical protein ABSF61_00620 [Anaerolineales bacterium]